MALVVLIAGGVAFVLLHAPGNVSHPNISFTTTTSTTTSSTTTTTTHKAVVVDDFLWPRYGYDAGRTRYFDGPRDLAPPLRVGWIHHDYALLEFPPVIYRTTLYFMNDGGWVKGVDALTGKQLWQTHVGTLAAASPAIGVREGLLYVPVLSTYGSSPGGGRFVALSMRTGHIAWSIPIGAGTESSPMVWDKSVYFGDQAGNVYSVNARNGHIDWTYHASGAVKGGPALADGKLYFGDYAGPGLLRQREQRPPGVGGEHERRAISASARATSMRRRRSPSGACTWATPTVACTRSAARTGALAWATGTGRVRLCLRGGGRPPGLGPTVYVGSYDGNFYAFNAQSGAIRWRHPAGGRISGSATVVGNVVYYSDLGHQDDHRPRHDAPAGRCSRSPTAPSPR